MNSQEPIRNEHTRGSFKATRHLSYITGKMTCPVDSLNPLKNWEVFGGQSPTWKRNRLALDRAPSLSVISGLFPQPQNDENICVQGCGRTKQDTHGSPGPAAAARHVHHPHHATAEPLLLSAGASLCPSSQRRPPALLCWPQQVHDALSTVMPTPASTLNTFSLLMKPNPAKVDCKLFNACRGAETRPG